MTNEEIKKLANAHCGIAENIDFEFDFEERYFKGQSMVDKYNAFIAGYKANTEQIDAYKEAVKVLNEKFSLLFKEKSENKWINVSNDLPKTKLHVLRYDSIINSSQKNMAVSITDSDRLKYCDENTYWMYIPNLPKKLTIF